MDGEVGHNVLICNAGAVKSWGYNTYGQVGDGSATLRFYPVSLPSILNPVAVAAGSYHSLVLRNNGTVWGWGLAPGAGSGYAPVLVAGLTDVISIACGENLSLAVKNDGTVWAWGDNQYGQLGDLSTVNRAIPIQVVGLAGVIAVAAGKHHAIALKADGTVWTWGRNNYGQLGTGSVALYSTSATQVAGLTGIVSLASGGENNHTLVLKNDGSAWAWGYNGYGQIGDLTLISKNTPVQVNALMDVTELSTGEHHSLALTADSTVWAWGSNSYGQLGVGPIVSSNSPLQISTLNDIVSIAGGWGHSMALKNNGSLWTWGNNSWFELGDSTATNRNIPVLAKSVLCPITPLLKLTHSKVNVLCFGDNTGSAAVQALSGTPPYTYLWSNGQTSQTAINLVAGTYTVTVTDSKGISCTRVITITSSPVLGYSSSITNISCNGGSNGAVNISVGGGAGIGTILYSWSNGAITQDISGLTAGSYTLTKIDSVCKDTTVNTYIVTQPAVLTSTITSAGATCGKNNGSASSVTSGGTLPYYHLWSNGSTSSSLTNLAPGSYTLTTTDAKGCSVVTVVNIPLLSPALTAAITSVSDVACDLDSTGSASATVYSGTSLYTYSWNSSPVQTTPTAVGLPKGEYILTITDAAGCVFIDTTNVSVINPININVSASATLVFPGTPVTLTATGPSSLSWSSGITNGVSFTPGSTNAYSVTGTNGGACFNVVTIIVTVLNPSQIISGGLGHSLAVCTSTNANAWGYNSTGQIGDGTLVERDNPVVVSGITGVEGIAAGYWHSLAVKSDGTVRSWGRNNAGQLGDGTVTQRVLPVPVIGLTGIVAIAGGKEHSMALKNNGTVWTFGKNTSGQLGDGTTTIRPSAVQVTGLTGIVAIAAGYNHSLALKNDGTVWAFGSNGWGQLGTSVVSTSNIAIQVPGLTNVVAIAAGENHSLFLKDDGTVWACGINNNGELGDNTIIYRTTPVQVTSLTNIVAIAAGMSHSLAVKSNGTVWAWGLNGSGQLGDGFTVNRIVPVQTVGLTGVGLVAGGSAHSLAIKNDGTVHAWGLNVTGQIGDGTNLNYRYTEVQSAVGCSVAGPLTIVFSSSSTVCSNGTGTATASVAGGLMPYVYLWSDGQTTSTATGLTSGTYTVTVTDNAGNTQVSTITITNGPLVLPAITNVSCFSANDGVISVSAFGGSGGFIYEWMNGATTQAISGLSPGVYTLNFIDSVCNDTSVYSFTITQPGSLGVTITVTSPSCGINNGAAVPSVIGGTLPYAYLWSNGMTTSSVNSLLPGAYSVQITDINGCQSSAIFNLSTTSGPVTATVSSISPVCSGGNNGSATATPTSGLAPFNYNWNTTPVQSTPTATNLMAAQYIVSITDANGCNSIDTVLVNPTPPVPVIANSTSTIIIPGSSITLTGSGANAYSWSSGITNGVSFMPVTSSTYTVTGTTAAGCSNTSAITVTLKLKHKTIASGNAFSLAICNDSLGQSWGSNSGGQLGIGSTIIAAPTPVSILNLTSVTDVAAGQLHAFAILKDGSLYSWGNNVQGELGIGSTTSVNIPQQITLSNVIDVAGGVNFGIALRTDGTVWGWGYNALGNLGDSTNVSTTSPVMIPAFKGVIAVAAGAGHALALKDDGTVWAWGANYNGELGDSSTISRNYPVKVKGLSNVVDISTCGSSSLAIKNDGTVWGWGSNYNGELGIGMSPPPYYHTYAVQMDSINSVVAVASGYQHSLILKSDGTVYSTGSNEYGQLGDGTASAANPKYYPYHIASLNNVIEISGAYQHSLCKKTDKTYWSWGRNWSGALGDGSGADQYFPVVVAAPPSCITAGIEETHQLTDNMIIYPNPGNGNFTLQYTGIQLSSFTIINMLGEKITEQKIEGVQTKFNLSDQPSGIYFMKIESETGNLTKKIIIQK